jgi:hypothetical protein
MNNKKKFNEKILIPIAKTMTGRPAEKILQATKYKP